MVQHTKRDLKNYGDSTLYNIHTYESFGKACGEIILNIFNLKEKGYDTLILPSRGSFPVWRIGVELIEKYGKDKYQDHLSEISCLNDYSKTLLKWNIPIEEGKFRIVLVPFTADYAVNRDLDPEGAKKDYNKIVEGIRKYYCDFTSSLFREPKKRNQFCFNTQKKLLENIEGREILVDEYENLPKIGKACIIDTVISGRASETIWNGFNELKLNEKLTYLLLIDKEGEKLKKKYFFEKGNICKYNVKSIITENKGAGFLGCAAIIYPDLLHKIDTIYPYAGAGSWHPVENIDEKHKKTFELNIEAACMGAELSYHRSSGEKRDIESLEEEINKKIKEIKEYIQKYKILSKNEPYIPPNVKRWVKRAIESSAHVSHNYLTGKKVKEFFRTLEK